MTVVYNKHLKFYFEIYEFTTEQSNLIASFMSDNRTTIVLLPYTGLGPFQVLKVQSELVRWGGGGGMVS